VQPAQVGVRYPLCIAGRRACPPEDIGGIYGYEDFLGSPERQKQYGHEKGYFDPAKFDLDEVNDALQSLPKRWKPW